LRAAAEGNEGVVDIAGFGNSLDGYLTQANQANAAELTRILTAQGRPNTERRVVAWEATGGKRDTEAMSMRVLALSEPAEFARQRKAAVDIIELNVNNTFKTSYDQFKAAGYDGDYAEKEALKAANVVKDAQFRALHAKFGDESLFLKGTAHHSDGYKIPH
jgi:hypothetical protein